MAWLLRMGRGIAVACAFVVMLAASNAQAQTSLSPIGQWEVSISGKLSGTAAKGIAYVEFLPDGSLAGYALLRQSAAFSTFSGSWSLSSGSFAGVVHVDTGGLSQSFVLAGKVARNGSMSASLRSGLSDRMTLKGKRLIPLTNRSGNYFGQFRQYGMTGSVSLTFSSEPSLPGAYQINGFIQLAGITYQISGAGIVDRAGNLIAYVDNLNAGGGGMLWGKFKPTGALAGSGIDAGDRSSIRFALTR